MTGCKIKITFAVEGQEDLVCTFELYKNPTALRWASLLFTSLKYGSSIVNCGNFSGLDFEKDPTDKVGSFINVNFDPPNSSSLVEADYDNFSTRKKFGEILLTYEGTGKSVYQAFLADETPSIQTQISSSFEISFYDDLSLPESELIKIKSWIEANYNEEGEDLLRCLGQIPVGRLTRDSRNKDTLKKIATVKKIKNLEVEGEFDFEYATKKKPFSSIIGKYVEETISTFKKEFLITEYAEGAESDLLSDQYTGATLFPNLYTKINIKDLNKHLKKVDEDLDFVVVLSQGSLVHGFERFNRCLNDLFNQVEDDIMLVGEIQSHRYIAPIVNDGFTVINIRLYREAGSPPLHNSQPQVVVRLPGYSAKMLNDSPAYPAEWIVKSSESEKDEFKAGSSGSELIARGIEKGFKFQYTPAAIRSIIATINPKEDQENKLIGLQNDWEVIRRKESLGGKALKEFDLPIPSGSNFENIIANNWFVALRYLRESGFSYNRIDLFSGNTFDYSFTERLLEVSNLEELFSSVSDTKKRNIGNFSFDKNTQEELDKYLKRYVGPREELEKVLSELEITSNQIIRKASDLPMILEKIDSNKACYIYLGDFLFNRMNLFNYPKRELENIWREFLAGLRVLYKGSDFTVHRGFRAAWIRKNGSSVAFVSDGQFKHDYWLDENWIAYEEY